MFIIKYKVYDVYGIEIESNLKLIILSGKLGGKIIKVT